ncbi:hypothetical protein [Parasitella parasitica]|uniref:CSC1/OSCA1-like 7TM region domain-containing protein n=1 Tax=Parasitella parasitica TaxID=35722 RepID=A0A0B7N7T4_9FUNG|nr:hypothetical protein [Parasitella parasitica]
MSVYVPFEDQRKQDATFTIKAMGIQLGINVGTAIAVMIGFSILRPRHTLVYAPKSKFATKEHQPPVIESRGWFSWIGCDAVLYIRFVRLLRKMLFYMSIIGIGALIPIYIVATKSTGDWPPTSGSIEILSLAGINLHNGKTRPDANFNWYWAPFSATYLFSILIAYFMYRASCDYIQMRQYYFRLPQNEASMKTLIVSRVPPDMQTDDKLKQWVSKERIPHPILQAMIGHDSAKLNDLMQQHQKAVQNLETTLAAYLSDGKQQEKKPRPLVRIGGFLMCGGRKVDAIEHYTQQVAGLDKEIKALRKSTTTRTAHYGWISFNSVHAAHATERWSLVNKGFDIRLSPTPTDLVWSNLPLDHKTRQAKRWMGHVVYWVFVFAWMIPMSALSATSNIVNLIRLIPNSAEFINAHQVLMGLIQAYFSPIMMAVFLYLLPRFFRFLSQQQGYWTQTTLDRKVLTKLYIFFIINNLLVFTLTSMFIGIYGQIRALVESGSLPTTQESIAEYVMQIAKNIAEVSTFWINFVCLKSLTLTMDLAMLVPLLTITIRKFITRPSPRELRELAKPPEFDYPQNYNLLLFFFTITLVYSAMSPLILPFALLYFAVAGLVYKYMLMYVFVTKIESGGKIWPVLFQTVMTSVFFFQLTMIVMLVLKGGHLQAYCLIPLPVLTLLYQCFYHRRIHALGTYISGSDTYHVLKDDGEEGAIDTREDNKNKHYKQQSLQAQFQDPAYYNKLSAPTVHDDVKHLLQKVYKAPQKMPAINETIEKAQQFGKTIIQDIDLDSSKGFNQSHRHRHRRSQRMTIYDQGCPVLFETVPEDQILDQDSSSSSSNTSSSSDEEEEEEKQQMSAPQRRLSAAEDQLSRFSTYTSSFGGSHSEDAPLLSHSLPVPPFHAVVPRQSQNKRNVISEYIEMYSSFTPNTSLIQLPCPQDENSQIDNDAATSLDEFCLLYQQGDVAQEQRLSKRHTAPVSSQTDVVVDDEAAVRHNSLPIEFYQAHLSPGLSLENEEEEDDDDPLAAANVARQLSLPATRTRQENSIQRSRTMPSSNRRA